MTATNPHPVALFVRCCDNHVDCNAAPRDAVHRFMDSGARRTNRDTALAALRAKYATDPTVDCA